MVLATVLLDAIAVKKSRKFAAKRWIWGFDYYEFVVNFPCVILFARRSVWFSLVRQR